MMNSARAKVISLVDFLVKINAKHSKTIGDNAWFFSPLRDDGSEASFKVSIQRNVWYDHVLGVGGTIIDLVMEFYRLRQVDEALKKIDEIWNGASFTPPQIETATRIKEESTGDDTKVSIRKVAPLQNKALLDYLESRKISLTLAQKYLNEIYYTVERSDEKKNFFGLSFSNRSGGYEVRNAYSKNCIGGKDISIIKGMDSSKVSVFEGFFSFLSMLQLLKIEKFSGDVIVMNSVNMKHRAAEFIALNNYETVYGFLDNDLYGSEATAFIFQRFGVLFQDARPLFKGFKDPNDKLRGLPLPTKN